MGMTFKIESGTCSVVESVLQIKIEPLGQSKSTPEGFSIWCPSNHHMPSNSSPEHATVFFVNWIACFFFWNGVPCAAFSIDSVAITY